MYKQNCEVNRRYCFYGPVTQEIINWSIPYHRINGNGIGCKSQGFFWVIKSQGHGNASTSTSIASNEQ